MKKHCVCLMIYMAVLWSSISVSVALAEVAGASDIGRYMKLYGFTMPQSVEKIVAKTENQIPLGEITINCTEVLFDGVWCYTSLDISPQNCSDVLIMPGGAEILDCVSGGNGENERSDKRSYKAAALEDGKRLLCVYAYPSCFERCSTYALDYFKKAITLLRFFLVLKHHSSQMHVSK